jgi:elongation factor P
LSIRAIGAADRWSLNLAGAGASNAIPARKMIWRPSSWISVYPEQPVAGANAKTEHGAQVLFLYRRNGYRFLPATAKPKRWHRRTKWVCCSPNRLGDRRTHLSGWVGGQKFRKTTLKVIASSIRKGNVIEQDGKLYVVLTAENIHPGKGTPVSQIEMRRIGDGVKISERYKTTDQVEKATIEDHNYNYLYEDADGFHFMNAETYDQVQVSKEIIGSAAPYLQENMSVKLSLHDMVPVAIQMPQRATLEVVETEPVTKGQTASSSYKPAILSNGVRTAVPPHIGTGTRIVIMTEDGSYVERAKD